MKVSLVTSLILFIMLSVCSAQTDSVTNAINNTIKRRTSSADSITPEKLNRVLQMINNKASTINNKIVGTFDSNRIYRYVGNYGVTPTLNPPQISYFAASNLGEFYLWDGNNWLFIGNFLTQTDQVIRGNKNFTGKITTNGLTSFSNSSTAALTTNGVVSQRDTTVATDLTLDGNYGSIGFDCSNGSITATLPNATNAANWIFYIRKEDNTTNNLTIKRSDNSILYTISSKFSLAFKSKNGLWSRIY